MRPRLFFIPSYVGSLKYQARLSRYLEEKYESIFVLIHEDKRFRDEMIAYCHKNKLPFFVLIDGIGKETRLSIPFLGSLWARYFHSKKCRKLLIKEKPTKVISTKAIYPHDTILKEANRLGIETIVLQWAFYAPRYAGIKNKSKGGDVPFLKKVYYFFLSATSSLFDVVYREPRYGFKQANPRKVGVFTKEDAEHESKFYAPETIKVVGTIDFQAVNELKRKIITSENFKNELLKKYGLKKETLKIVVILYRFYYHKDEHRMAKEDHIKHYYDVFKWLREVFSPDEAEILLKMHPSEEQIYDSYRELGIKLYHDEANTDELVCLADLYIADPSTSVNMMVLGSGVEALFINFSHLTQINNCAKYYNIRHVVTAKSDFIEKLKKFKKGLLEKQYDNGHVEFRSVDKIKEFIDL